MCEIFKAQEIAMDREFLKQLENGNIRRCSCCGNYVSVDEYQCEYNDVVVDCCDDCVIKYFDKKENTLRRDKVLNKIYDCVEDYI